MSTISISQYNPSRKAQITAQWVGKGLAVHEEVVIHRDGSVQFINAPNEWVFTCVNTGKLAGFFSGDLQKAIAIAQEWDEAFVGVCGNVPQRLRSDFRAAIYRAKAVSG